MKPYHSVAMYNQAVQVLQLPRSPHHPPLQLWSTTSLKLPFSSNDFCLKSVQRLEGHCVLATQAQLNAHSTVRNI